MKYVGRAAGIFVVLVGLGCKDASFDFGGDGGGGVDGAAQDAGSDRETPGHDAAVSVDADAAHAGGGDAASGSDAASSSATDAALSAQDASVAHDAAVGEDASVELDAALAQDASLVQDAAVGEDASLVQDAAVGEDASLAQDAMVGEDASLAQDAGADASVPTYVVSGTIVGLDKGGAVLANNGADELAVPSDGEFEFPTTLLDGDAYLVEVVKHSGSISCVVMNGSGKIASDDVTDVTIVCMPSAPQTYSIGGTVTGLVGSLTIDNHGVAAHNTAVSGPFHVATQVASGTSYDVTIGSAPGEQSCSVSNGMGTVASADVTDIAIDCVTKTYPLSGTISGLTKGAVAVLSNAGDDIKVDTNGKFVFDKQLAAGAQYDVAVTEQPAGLTCTVSAGNGSMPSGGTMSVLVTCGAATYSVGGTATGLTGPVVLRNNGGDELVVAGDGAFTFATPAVTGSPYVVTVRSSGLTAKCKLSNADGKIDDAPVKDVALDCAPTKPRFAFASGLTRLFTFGIDGTAGTLQELSAYVASNLNALAINAAGSVLYAADQQADVIRIFDVNATTGALVERDTDLIAAGVQAVAAGDAPSSIVLSPGGTFLYVGNINSGTLSVYSVAAGGNLLRVDADAVMGGMQDLVAGAFLTSLSFAPSGAFLYAMLGNNGGFLAYSVNQATGALTALPNTPYNSLGLSAVSLTVSPSGGRAYVTSYFNDGVYALPIAQDGALGAAPPIAGAGSRPRAPLTFVPGTPYAYVSNTVSNDVTGFQVDPATGVLTKLASAPFPAGAFPNMLAAHPDGMRLYVLHFTSQNVWTYAVDGGSGALTALPITTPSVASALYAIAITP